MVRAAARPRVSKSGVIGSNPKSAATNRGFPEFTPSLYQRVSTVVTFTLKCTGMCFKELWNGTGKALLFCGASNVIGFGSLILSSSDALVSLGQVAVIGILLSMTSPSSSSPVGTPGNDAPSLKCCINASDFSFSPEGGRASERAWEKPFAIPQSGATHVSEPDGSKSQTPRNLREG